MSELEEEKSIKEDTQEKIETRTRESDDERGVSLSIETKCLSNDEKEHLVSVEKVKQSDKVTLDDMFNPDVRVVYDSDADEDAKDNKKGDQEKSDNLHEVSCGSSESSDSDSDSGGDSDEANSDQETAVDDLEDEGMEGPIISKNEIVNEKVETLPHDFKIEEDIPINYVGTVTGVVERSIIVKGEISAEEKVLNNGTVLCLEDRTPLGFLYEVFGRLQSPVYRIKFNNDEECAKFGDLKGQKVFFVVPSANYLWTKQIRSMKGTDASNANDEELPEEEQEFSDDELEAAAKKQKNKRKNKSSKTNEEKKQKTKSGPKLTGLFTSLPSVNKKTLPPPPTSILPTNHVEKQNDSQYHGQNNILENGMTNVSNSNTLGQTSNNINAIEMMKTFVQIFEQTQKLPQLSQIPPQNVNFSPNIQPGQQLAHPHQFYHQPANNSLPQQQLNQPSIPFLQQGYQQPGYQQLQPVFNPYTQYSHNSQFQTVHPGHHMSSTLQQQQQQQQQPQQHHFQPQQQPNIHYQQFSPMNAYQQQEHLQTQKQEVHQAPQQTAMHNISPNQTDTTMILAQLSNKISNQANNLASQLQSHDDEYDPANP